MSSPKARKDSRLARAVAAEVQSVIAVRGITQRDLARMTGLSQNYISTRLRNELPLDLGDMEMICKALGLGDPAQFIVTADERWGDEMEVLLMQDDFQLAAKRGQRRDDDSDDGN